MLKNKKPQESFLMTGAVNPIQKQAAVDVGLEECIWQRCR